jgi:hypothetical protein
MCWRYWRGIRFPNIHPGLSALNFIIIILWASLDEALPARGGNANSPGNTSTGFTS